MNDGTTWMIIGGMLAFAVVVLAISAQLIWGIKDDTVIGSELDRRWRDVEHAHLMQGQEHISPRSVMDPRGIVGSPSGADSIIGMNLGPISASKPHTNRVDHGFFGVGNRPPNAGTSKQIERLHLAGVPHASAVAMIDADCTQQERHVIHMREHGDSLTLIAGRLGVSVAKVRRLEAKAVDKILAARKEPS